MNKVKKLTLFILLSFFLTSCATLTKMIDRKPSAKMEKVELHSISFDHISLKTRLSVSNPYPLALSLKGIELKALVENAQVFYTKSSSKIKIAPNGKSYNDFIIKLKFKDIQKSVSTYMSQDYINLTLDSKVKLDLPEIPGLPLKYDIPLRVTKKLPAVKISISMKKFNIDIPSQSEIINVAKRSNISLFDIPYLVSVLNGKRSSRGERALKKLDIKIPMNLTFEVKNLAKSAIKLDNFNYNIKVNNQSMAEGVTDSIINNGRSSEINVKSNLNLSSLSFYTLKSLKSGKFNYKLDGRTKFSVENSILSDPMDVDFSKSGSFR